MCMRSIARIHTHTLAGSFSIQTRSELSSPFCFLFNFIHLVLVIVVTTVEDNSFPSIDVFVHGGYSALLTQW